MVDSSNLTDQTTLFNCRRIKFKLDPDVLKLRQLESCNVSSACVDILNVVSQSRTLLHGWFPDFSGSWDGSSLQDLFCTSGAKISGSSVSGMVV